ncbi:MAG: tRNA preQ1(34) S-adenosylmethionine ribosyltransferase-isomerase QueA [Candidatus Acidiferrales bacterium]
MKLSDFDYELLQERIAQEPAEPRDASRMLVLGRQTGRWEDHWFRELPALLSGDELVVVNNTRVIAARLFGRRAGARAAAAGKQSRAKSEHLSAVIEVLLTRQISEGRWQALVRPGRKVPVGQRIIFGEGELEAQVIGRGDLGLRELRLSSRGPVAGVIERLGHVPLPPYIERSDEPRDRERYQTLFAQRSGAVAAPTAGLHFTPEVLERLRARGVELAEITLHVGLGTFQPIHQEEIERHKMHSEAYEISPEMAERICAAKASGRPVLAVGTTVVRALEDAAARAASGEKQLVAAGAGEAAIFIRPGYCFRIVDQMLTNFHLPRSSLLVMVSAFAGRELILEAYHHAIRSRYRFYSYGDCMLIR